MLSDQRHHRDLTQHVGMGIERDTVGISLDPKRSTEFLQGSGETEQVGFVGRRADVDIERSAR